MKDNGVTLSFKRGATALLVIAVFVPTIGSSQAQERSRRDRPLTITKRAVPHGRTGIEVRNGGSEIIAWGGFSSNGYGYGRMGRDAANRAARNELVRERTAGLYGYGFDGLGGTGFDDDRNSGFNNPSYGNAYNSYVGYNGVPTAFAFGPAFANRHITDSDDDASDIPGPTPGELGYATPAAIDGLE